MDEKQLEKLDSLAKEAIRCAMAELSGTVSHGRALEALKEFRDACDAPLILDLIRERRSAIVGR